MDIQDFIEGYLPNYARCQDVARLDDLHRFLDGEMDQSDYAEYGLDSYTHREAFDEYIEIQNKLFSQAFEVYMVEQKIISVPQFFV